MISGASHLWVPTVLAVAVTAKTGPELTDVNPHSVKRARPSWSMTTFACPYRISVGTLLRNKEKEISTLQVR